MNEKKTESKDVKHLYTEEYFLGSATGHDEFRAFKGKYDQLIVKFRMVIRLLELNPSESFLDIGCGRGELVIHHALAGGKSTGVDFSPEAIKLAKEKADELQAECSFIVSSFENIDETKKFDKLTSIDFIEHISAEEGNLFFSKCFDLLNPNGRLLVYTYPNTIRRKYGYKLIRFLSILKGRPAPKKESDTVSSHYKQYHLNEQNYYALRNSARRAGFRKVKVLYFDESAGESFLKRLFLNTPLRHLFMKGLTLIADK